MFKRIKYQELKIGDKFLRVDGTEAIIIEVSEIKPDPEELERLLVVGKILNSTRKNNEFMCNTRYRKTHIVTVV